MVLLSPWHTCTWSAAAAVAAFVESLISLISLQVLKRLLSLLVSYLKGNTHGTPLFAPPRIVVKQSKVCPKVSASKHVTIKKGKII